MSGRLRPGVVLAVLLLAGPAWAAGSWATASGGVPPSSYQISQFPIPPGSSGPMQITSDATGAVWFVEQGSNQVASVNEATHQFTEYDIPTANALPQGISVDPLGNVWFAELTPSKLAEIPSGTAGVREVAIPPGPFGLPCGPVSVTPYGKEVWVPCEFSNQIDEYFTANGTFHQFDLPVGYSAPTQLVFDSSGKVWFTAADAGMIGQITVDRLRPGTTDGISEFAPLNSTYVTTIENPLFPSGRIATSLASPSQMAIGQDGSVWVTEHAASSFDRYSVGSGNLDKFFTSPGQSPFRSSLPNGIAIDGAGDVWVAEHYGNRIAEFDPASGSMTEYPVPCCGSQLAAVLYLATGSDGTVWFTEFFGNAIGVLIPQHEPSRVAVSLSPKLVALDSGGTATVSVGVSYTGGAGTEPERFSLGIQGVTIGGLVNVTAVFSTNGFLLRPNSTARSNLSLVDTNLRPGSYFLTVGATGSLTGAVTSTVLALTVQGERGPDWQTIGVVLVLVSAAAAVMAVGMRPHGFMRRKAEARGRRHVWLSLR